MASAISAKTANGLQFDFILSASIAGSVGTWVTFTVREDNKEILKVQNDNLPSMLTSVRHPLVQAADELFAKVFRTTQVAIGRAIKKLDEM